MTRQKETSCCLTFGLRLESTPGGFFLQQVHSFLEVVTFL
jgi:hypothetical protein